MAISYEQGNEQLLLQGVERRPPVYDNCLEDRWPLSAGVFSLMEVSLPFCSVSLAQGT